MKMNYKNIFGLILLSAFIGACSVSKPEVKHEPRPLYVFSFGGLEKMPVVEVVEMLDSLDYAGVTADARDGDDRQRLSQYYDGSEQKGDDFEVVYAFIAHRFDKYGFSATDHKAAIDMMEGKNGHLWGWFRDVAKDGSVTDEKVETLIREIVDYAASKGVKFVLYSHVTSWFPDAESALALVEKINHPSFGLIINLSHEIRAGKGSPEALAQTFEKAKDRIFDLTITGALLELDRTSSKTLGESTVRSLDKSEYDLRPYMRLIKKSGFEGPICFVNFKLERRSPPKDYLAKTMNRWKELCEEVGLYEIKNN